MTATLVQPISEPGLYEMSNAEYHAQPALSASGMKVLLDAPAKFKHQQQHRVFRDSFDFGSVWHALVLQDKGEQIVVAQKVTRDKQRVDADSWDTKSAQEHRASIRAEGKIPVLAKEYEIAKAMAAAFNAHPEVRRYLDLKNGSIEQSAFWNDERTGLPLRARFDYLPAAPVDGVFTICDPKSAVSSEPFTWLRKAADFGYHLQDEMYRRAAMAMGLSPRPDFLFLVQEKTPPYIVTPIRFPAHTRAVASLLVDRAIDRFIACTESGEWGGYVDGVVTADLPSYYLNQFEGMI